MKLRIVCLLLALALLAGCQAPAQPAAEPTEALPVLTCEAGAYAMDSSEFQYYFGFCLAGVLEQADRPALDLSADLAAQPYDEAQSWRDYLIAQSLTLAEETMQLCLAAQGEGFQLPNEAGDFDAILVQTAQDAGYPDAAAYLTAYYGEGANAAGYAEFLRNMALAQAYSVHLYEDRTFTTPGIEAFYDSRAEDYANHFGVPKTDHAALDVRIIRFYPDDAGSEADWIDAEARAQAVADEFAADPTEDRFLALAQEHTEDYLSPDGGLYTAIHPGSMDGALDAWLFPADALRQPGDWTLLREDDAAALCYVSAADDRPYWQVVAEQDLRYAEFFNTFSQMQQTYVFERHPEQVTLHVPTAQRSQPAVPDGVEAEG